MVSDEHKKRVIEELKKAGVTRYGLSHAESKYLPQIIHNDEHIGGVVYGRYAMDFVMLVATDKRIIYLMKKPFFSKIDELTYDVVSGVKNSNAVLFSTVTLHTRIQDYVIKFVNPGCASKFVKFIEERRVKKDGYKQTQPQPTTLSSDNNPLDIDDNDEGLVFLKEHEVAVLSTSDKEGKVSGAVMYYMVHKNQIYIITRSSTKKARNIFNHKQVALTVYEPFTLKTVQLSGIAEVEKDYQTSQNIFDQMIKTRQYKDGEQLPPVTKFTEGTYTVIRITPTEINYRDFAK